MLGMTRIEFINGGAHHLATSIDLPDGGDGPFGVVIVVHGLTGHRIGPSYRHVALARQLNDAGIACVRFDQSGCGESTGLFVEHTIQRMVDDTLAVRNWATQQSWCDPARVGLVGASVGALGVVAADAAERSKAVAIWGGVYDMPRVFTRTAKTGLRALVEHQGWVPYRALPVGRAFVDTLDAVDVPARLADSDAPILLCHSPEDDVVEFSEAQSYVERCDALSRPYELIKFRDATHDFTDYAHRQLLLKRTTQFFDEHLQ